MCLFRFSRQFQTVFQRSCAHLYCHRPSPWGCTHQRSPPQPAVFQTYFWLRDCWLMVSRCEFKWHEVEHLCLCLLAIQLSCFVKHGEKSFLFANWVDFFLPIRKISSCIMVTRPFVGYMCCRNLLICDLFSDEQKFFFLKQLNISTISFMDCTFHV